MSVVIEPVPGTPPDAEAQVKEFIAQMGGGQAMMQSMAAFREVARRMDREASALVKLYPNQWAAMAPGTEPVIGKTRAEARAKVAALTGGDLTGVVTEYLDPDPPVLIV